MTHEGASPLAKAAAEVLMELSAQLEQIGENLCGDPALAAKHIEHLQAVDLIAQTQRSLASVLSAECPERAIDDLGLDHLKARLQNGAT